MSQTLKSVVAHISKVSPPGGVGSAQVSDLRSLRQFLAPGANKFTQEATSANSMAGEYLKLRGSRLTISIVWENYNSGAEYEVETEVTVTQKPGVFLLRKVTSDPPGKKITGLEGELTAQQIQQVVESFLDRVAR